MTDDSELLEAAARAAGLEIRPHPNRQISDHFLFISNGKNWNPIRDVGDRYHLLQALKMGIDFTTQEVIYWRGNEPLPFTESFAEDGDDARAVLRAAADIGRARK